LETWARHSRNSYNKAIGIIKSDARGPVYKDTLPEFSNTIYSKLELRDMIVPEVACGCTQWFLETPKHVREAAVFEARKNLKTCITNLENGNIKYFNLRFMSKRKESWSISVPASSIKVYGKSVGIYESSRGLRVKTTEVAKEVNHDCKIHFDGLHYYLCIPEERKLKTNNKFWFASLDPGVRKFQTIFSPDANEHIVLADRASTRMYSCLSKLDSMVSNNVCKRKRLKLRMKIQNLQKELHYKTANFLTSRYQHIFAPKLTKNNDIINKSRRKIRSKTVRNMVVLGHCKFIERLKTKAEEFTNVKVYVVGEEYTSQICLKCKELTKTCEETFVCSHCRFRIDRDVLGSTNILLKHW
jgi:putative transposase